MISETDVIAIQNLFQEIEGIRGSSSLPFSQLTEKELKEFKQPIERKMDFTTLKKNLNENNYKSLETFKEDLSLIWKNVLHFSVIFVPIEQVILASPVISDITFQAVYIKRI